VGRVPHRLQRPAYQPLEFGQFTIGVRNGFNPVAVIVKNTATSCGPCSHRRPGADTSNPFTQGWTLDTLINPDFGYGYTESDGSGTPSFQIPGKNAVNLSDAGDLGGPGAGRHHRRAGRGASLEQPEDGAGPRRRGWSSSTPAYGWPLASSGRPARTTWPPGVASARTLRRTWVAPARAG
jgi:hypothetical protein